tara:strand:+ start:563 stop:829 length:267 start_codon:yes stop_codon:yes gene_type:complete
VKVVNNMKEFNIKLSEEKEYTDSMENPASEIDLVLQVWQDLRRLSETSDLAQEDLLIKKVLEQILEVEYDKDIPVPDFYTYHERHKTD